MQNVFEEFFVSWIKKQNCQLLVLLLMQITDCRRISLVNIIISVSCLFIPACLFAMRFDWRKASLNWSGMKRSGFEWILKSLKACLIFTSDSDAFQLRNFSITSSQNSCDGKVNFRLSEFTLLRGLMSCARKAFRESFLPSIYSVDCKIKKLIKEFHSTTLQSFIKYSLLLRRFHICINFVALFRGRSEWTFTFLNFVFISL